jgi:hypothetical protein
VTVTVTETAPAATSATAPSRVTPNTTSGEGP